MQSRHALLQTSINIFGIMHTLSSLKILHLAIMVSRDAAYPSLLVYYACMQYAGHCSIFVREKKKKTDGHSLSLNSRTERKWAKGGRESISMQVNQYKCRKQRSRGHIKDFKRRNLGDEERNFY